MIEVAVKLDKPFGVLVKTGGKTVLKQFDEEIEVTDFIVQIEKFSNVEFEILERPKRGIAGRPYSDAFVEIQAVNVPGGVWYKCVPVRPRKGVLFCTECHDYRKFIKEVDELTAEFKCCEECGMPDTEYYIRIANGKE